MKESVRIRIYQSVATGAAMLTDTGEIEVIATETYGAAVPAELEADYWIQINTSSELLIPTARFGNASAHPASDIFCSPDDLAVFEFGRRRI
jgi:hypothetical protein